MSERGAFDRLRLQADGASAEICRHGAHVLGWRPRGAAMDRLFLSARSVYADGAAIRGGVPVVFPQFSGFGPLPKHGFARDRAWRVVDASAADRVTLALGDDSATRALWPHAFEVELAVVLAADTLAIALTVNNTGDAPLSFTAALHTYLAVQSIAAVRVHGLAGARCLDATRGLAHGVEADAALCFDAEFDRVYPAVDGEFVVEDGTTRIVVAREGFPDAVVWNPGAEKAAALSDLEPGDHQRFVCVEPAVFDPPITLAPGNTWHGRQVLRHEIAASRENRSTGEHRRSG